MGVIGDVFNLLGLPREGLELLMGLEAIGAERPKMRPGPRSIRFLPRIIRFGLDKLLFPAKLTRFLRYLSETVREFDLENIPQMIQEEIWDALEELHSLNLEAAYYNIVTQLSYSLYATALRNQLKKLGLSFEDVKMGEEKIAEINPILRIDRLHAMLEGMPLYKRMKIKEGEIFEAPEAFKAGFKKLLSEFGHLSEHGNDFSSIPWRERPQIVLQMITEHVPVKDSDSKVYLDEVKGGGFRGILTRLIYRLVVRYQIYKERISFIYTKSYGLFRPYFLRLGEIFSEWGYIDDPEDIFFLEWSEIEELVKGGTMSENLFETLSRRKRDFEILRDIDLPDVIYGEEIPELVYTGEASNEIRGVAASSGYYRGKIKVIRGSEDFWRMKKGDILVMHHSDIGWAPLFARAGAIITEAGGVLSHAATIAREYGIPAVVGVKRASKLDEDKEVLVDGFTGKILLID